MEDHVSHLKKIFTSSEAVRETSWNELLSLIRVSYIKRNDFFLLAGESTINLGFVCDGLFRAYVKDENGNCINCGFYRENSFMMALVSLASHCENIVNIQAIEDSAVVSLDFRLVSLLFERHKCLKQVILQIIEYEWARREAHLIREHLYNQYERYQVFLEEYPGLENRLSCSDIASYLGVTPLQLSSMSSRF